MSMPYALLQPLMPDEHHGALTGFYSLSRGIGVALGPLVAGVVVGLAGKYAVIWAVCGVATLASLALIPRIASDGDS